MTAKYRQNFEIVNKDVGYKSKCAQKCKTLQTCHNDQHMFIKNTV